MNIIWKKFHNDGNGILKDEKDYFPWVYNLDSLFLYVENVFINELSSEL